MRSSPLRRLILALVCAAGLAPAASGLEAQRRAPEQVTHVSIELGDLPRLVAGQAARVPVIVELSEAQRDPLLLTFRARGGALDVVRERLNRQDAEELERPAGSARRRLRFMVPVFGASAGAALLEVRVDTYACERDSCAAVRGSVSAQIQVHPAS